MNNYNQRTTAKLKRVCNVNLPLLRVWWLKNRMIRGTERTICHCSVNPLHSSFAWKGKDRKSIVGFPLICNKRKKSIHTWQQETKSWVLTDKRWRFDIRDVYLFHGFWYVINWKWNAATHTKDTWSPTG